MCHYYTLFALINNETSALTYHLSIKILTFAPTMTYEALWHRLTSVYDTDEAKAIVRMVLDVRFGLTMADILCGKISTLSANDLQELEKTAQRLEKGEPVQYVLGVTDFCGRQFHVASGVLIPRPETAELCEFILSSHPVGGNILDIGTGSGCIATILALDIPNAKVTAWDISDEALCIAAGNAKRLGANVHFEHRDALNISLTSHFSPLTSEYDLIVSNPPYIQPSERDEMAKNVLDYEPEIALFATDDNPIIFYQRIGDYAIRNLNPGGRLYFELNPQTADAVVNYLKGIGFQEIETRKDQYGKQRFLKAKKI